MILLGGATHMLRHMWMCSLNGLLFHQQFLDTDSDQKKSLEEGPISKKKKKNWGRKILKYG